MAGTLTATPILSLLQLAADDDAGQRIFKQIIADYPASLRRRTAQLLTDADATPAQLHRFLRYAGFADLDDLRSRVGQESTSPIAEPDLYFTSRDGGVGTRSSLRKVLRREQHNLAETLEALQARGVLETAAAAILASRRRWVLGDMKSAGYAALVATDLGASLGEVTLVSPTAGAALAALTEARASDVLIAFSFRRYSRLTLQVAEQFRELGATVVAITDDYLSPISAFADHVLAVHTDSESAVHSPTAVAAAGHILASLAGAGAKGAARRGQRRAAMAQALGSYYDADLEGGAHR